MFDKARLKDYLNKKVEERRHIDVSLGHFSPRDNEEFFLNHGLSRPVISEDDFFEIASISKIFTALLTIHLSRQGHFKLHDYVEKFIPEIFIKNTITLYDLLSHIAGLPLEPPNFKSIAPLNSFISYTEEAFLADLKGLDFDTEKRGYFNYSNYGYLILGEVIKRVLSNRDFKDILTQLILRPLRLTDTKFDLTASESLKLRHGHTTKGEPVSPYLDLGPVYSSAGALITTTREMLRFCKIFMGNENVEDELRNSISDTLKPRADKSGKTISLGFHVRKLHDDLFFYHPGHIAGHKCSLIFSQSCQKAIVYNTTSSHHVRIVWDLIH